MSCNEKLSSGAVPGIYTLTAVFHVLKFMILTSHVVPMLAIIMLLCGGKGDVPILV